jgi:hypothetical protein
MGQVGSLMKVGDLIRNKQPGTTPAYITGMIVEIYPNGSTLYPGMLAKLLWFGGKQTVEFLGDLECHFEVISCENSPPEMV